MNNEKRVLARQGAIELTPSETDNVNGGFVTLLSLCSLPRPGTSGCDPDTSS